MKKAVVLSSGGIDSTTCLGLAIEKFGSKNVTAVSVSYGQKHTKELEKAGEVAKYYGVNHKVIDLSSTGIFEGSTCTLLNGNGEIEKGSYEDQIKDHGIVSSYVPFRNGLMLSLVAAVALSIYPDSEVDIYLGAHADDAAGAAYADCTPDFVRSMSEAIETGTYGKVNVRTPLINMNKATVVKTGLEIRAPYRLTWSCYEGGDKPCGKCGTCLDRIRAFEINGISDPAMI